MDTDSLLGLISDLYRQVAALSRENAALREASALADQNAAPGDA